MTARIKTRYWRIMQVDDDYKELEKETIEDLAEIPQKLLGKLGIAYGHELEQIENLSRDTRKRYECMMRMLDEGHFPVGLGTNAISHAWSFIEKAKEKGLSPDICFIDVKLEKAQYENDLKYTAILEEIDEVYAQIPQRGRSLLEQFAYEKLHFKERGGLYLAGKIHRLFTPPPRIILYTGSEKVQREMLPLIYSSPYLEIWPKGDLLDKTGTGRKISLWKILLEECQRRMLINGIVSQSLIVREVADFRRSIEEMSDRDDDGYILWKGDRGPNNGEEWDGILKRLHSLLTLRIGGESVNLQWSLASFFAWEHALFDLDKFSLSPHGMLRSLAYIIALVSEVDYCQALTTFIMGTPFVYAGHTGSPEYRLHPGPEIITKNAWLDDSRRHEYLKRIKSAWEKLPEGLRRHEDVARNVGSAVEKCEMYKGDARNNEASRAAMEAIHGFRTTLASDIGECCLEEESLDRLYYCRPWKEKSPLTELIRAILSHAEGQEITATWKPLEGAFDETTRSQAGRFHIKIVNHKEQFPHSYLLDSAFFSQPIGDLRQAISLAKGWVEIDIHSHGKRRDPHKIPFPETGPETNQCDKNCCTGKTVFYLSVYCVKVKPRDG